MKKVKTEKLVLHMEIDQTGNRTRLYIDVTERGKISHPIQFDIHSECTKQVVNDTGLAKHILNYFLRE